MEFKVYYKERLYFALLLVCSLVLYAVLLNFIVAGKANIGVLYFYGIVFVIGRLLMSTFFIGYLKGNAIKIGKNQFPEIFEILKTHSKVLGLGDIPDMYLLQGNGILNAFATRLVNRNFVVLHSDILEVAYQEGIDAVSFIIGHELGHIKRGHTGFLKSLFIWPAKVIPLLGRAYSRACEYTCDNIGYNLCSKGATKGILMLAAGKKLYTKVDIDALVINLEYNQDFSLWLAEFFSTHPALVKRISVINKLNDSLTDQFFMSPKVNFKNQEV